MLRRTLMATAALTFAIAGATTATAQGKSAGKDMQATMMRDVKWSPLQVPGFDPGASMSVLDGNPGTPGAVYTIRLKFPAGYRFPAHWHPRDEHLTVMSGSFQLGMGTSGDKAMEKTYAPGDFLMLPAKHPHYGGATQETVVQLHGQGPFQIFLSKGEKKVASGKKTK